MAEEERTRREKRAGEARGGEKGKGRERIEMERRQRGSGGDIYGKERSNYVDFGAGVTEASGRRESARLQRLPARFHCGE